jgi:hypothetical protein
MTIDACYLCQEARKCRNFPLLSLFMYVRTAGRTESAVDVVHCAGIVHSQVKDVPEKRDLVLLAKQLHFDIMINFTAPAPQLVDAACETANVLVFALILKDLCFM